MTIGFRYIVLSVTLHAAGAQGFEAASLKPARPGDIRGGMEFLPGGRFRAVNTPMLIILGTAYDVPWGIPDTLRIKGVPDWAITTRYDIEATPEKPTAASGPVESRNQKIRELLRAVLAARLQLRIHREMVDTAIYALTVGPHGARLEPSKLAPENCAESAPIGDGAACHQFSGGMGRGMHGAAVSLADLALYASNWSDHPILDRTGLTGLFNIQTEAWGAPILDDPSRASLFDLFDTLGLKLVPGKAPVEFWVIDHIEKPSEN